METTLKSLVQDVLNISNGGYTARDERISERQIEEWLNEGRAKFLHDDFNKGYFPNNNFEQDLGCVDLIQVPAIECANMGIPTSRRILRTSQEIPTPILSNYDDGITFIGLVDKVTQLSIIQNNRVPYILHDKFARRNVFVYWIENYIYVLNTDKLKSINIRGIFGDVSDVSRFKDCSGECCFTRDSRYPITKEMAYDLVSMVLKDRMGLTISMQPDTLDEVFNKEGEQQPQQRG